MLLFEKLLVRGRLVGLDGERRRENFPLQRVYFMAGVLIPWLALLALIASTGGFVLGLSIAISDAHRGEIGRIIFVHAPASWVAMLIYLATAASAAAGMAANARLAAMTAQALAPTGLMFAFFAVWSGSLWGKAIDGNWWSWDLRTGSELVLALFLAGFVGLHAAIEDLRKANRAGTALLLAGALCIPVNIAATQSWFVQHMSGAPLPTGAAGMGIGEMASLLAVTLGFSLYAGAAALLRLRCVILEKERQSEWLASYRSTAT